MVHAHLTSHALPSPAPPCSAQLSALQGEVERLQALLSDVVRGNRGGGPQYIYRDGSGNWWIIWYGIPAAGLAYGYMRIRGWRIGDLMYVTQGSLTNLRR